MRLSDEGKQLLATLAQVKGISQTAVVETLVRQEARREGVLYQTNGDGAQTEHHITSNGAPIATATASVVSTGTRDELGTWDDLPEETRDVLVAKIRRSREQIRAGQVTPAAEVYAEARARIEAAAAAGL